MKLNEIVLLLIIGLLAGFVSGSLGVGGGIIIVPALVFFMGLSQHEAQGTSLSMMLLPIGFFAAYTYYRKDFVNVRFAIILLIAFVLGAYLGSLFSISINERLLRKIFGIFLALVALKMILGK